MKHAYDVELYGNNPTVMDGSWKQLFDFDMDEAIGSVEDSVTEPPEKRRNVVAHEEENEHNTDGDRQHLGEYMGVTYNLFLYNNHQIMYSAVGRSRR
jgi:hypothetical protein